MSTMGTNVAQSVAGVPQAQQAAAPKPSRADPARERRAIRAGDEVVLSTELIDAVQDASNTTDEQPRQQQHHHPSNPNAESEGPPHIDVQA